MAAFRKANSGKQVHVSNPLIVKRLLAAGWVEGEAPEPAEEGPGPNVHGSDAPRVGAGTGEQTGDDEGEAETVADSGAGDINFTQPAKPQTRRK